MDLVPLSLKTDLLIFPNLKSTWAVDFPKSNSTPADLVNFPSQLEKYFSSGSGGSLCCPARPWTWYWRVLSGAGHCRGRGRPTSFQFLSSTFPARRIFRLIFWYEQGWKEASSLGEVAFPPQGSAVIPTQGAVQTHTHTKLTVCWCSSLGTPASSFAMSLFFNFGWIQDKKKGRKLVILYGSPKN